MSNATTLSELDRDRVVVTLRQIDRVARDLRREYPEAFQAPRPAAESAVPPTAAHSVLGDAA